MSWFELLVGVGVGVLAFALLLTVVWIDEDI